MQFVIRNPNGHTAPVEVEQGRDIILGRDSDSCHVVVLDPGVSQRHCKLSVDGGWAWVDDLGSSNGTFVNGRKVQIAPLGDGDVVRIGGSEIKVTHEDVDVLGLWESSIGVGG